MRSRFALGDPSPQGTLSPLRSGRCLELAGLGPFSRLSLPSGLGFEERRDGQARHLVGGGRGLRFYRNLLCLKFPFREAIHPRVEQLARGAVMHAGWTTGSSATNAYPTMMYVQDEFGVGGEAQRRRSRTQR